MAEGITIPSPSVFLATSPRPTASTTQLAERARPRQVRRPSQSKRTSSSTVTISEQTGKPKQSKSRNGCATCKAKRLKCDEEKPGCNQCAKRNVECGGYKKDFKWRPFEETSIRHHAEQRTKVLTIPLIRSPTQSSSTATPQSDGVETPHRLPRSKALHSRKDSGHHSVSAAESTAQLIKSPSEADDPTSVPRSPGLFHRALSFDNTINKQTTAFLQAAPCSPDDSQQVDQDYFTLAPSTSYAFTALSPTLSEILLPLEAIDASTFPELQLSNPLDNDSLQTILSSSIPDDVDIEEIPRDTLEDLPLTLSSTDSHDIFDLPWDLDMIPHPDQLILAEDSPEMLSLRFANLTCGILSVVDGPTENPWRNLIWPLTSTSPALYHAISAMTAFHSSTDVPALRLAGHEHKQASIENIREGIRDNSMSVQTAIATALALGFAESWDRHTASGNTHIKGAQALVKRALRDHKKSPLQGEDLARLKFLCNAWVYMDVIARLTSVDSDESNDFDSLYLFSTDPAQMTGQAQDASGFGIDFGMPIDARLDPLMGCAGTLFPIIGRVANLVRRVCRSQSNSPAVISQGSDLKTMLEQWKCPAFIETPEDPTTQIMHSLQTAEAYRWATLLHLHQSVPEIPSVSSADLARKVLTYLATVPLTSRTVIIHIYPLIVAGCEAWTLEDRQWVRDRWAAMAARMRIGSIEKCLAVTEEIWQRKDTYEAQPDTQRKLVATADLQPSRSGLTKQKRSHPVSPLAEPGKTGMVFTWIEDGNDEVVEQRSKWPARQCPKHVIGSMDPAYTVRGHLHWVGVMWDWGWEVLLG